MFRRPSANPIPRCEGSFSLYSRGLSQPQKCIYDLTCVARQGASDQPLHPREPLCSCLSCVFSRHHVSSVMQDSLRTNMYEHGGGPPAPRHPHTRSAHDRRGEEAKLDGKNKKQNGAFICCRNLHSQIVRNMHCFVVRTRPLRVLFICFLHVLFDLKLFIL